MRLIYFMKYFYVRQDDSVAGEDKQTVNKLSGLAIKV